jgi:hypothetical protein
MFALIGRKIPSVSSSSTSAFGRMQRFDSEQCTQRIAISNCDVYKQLREEKIFPGVRVPRIKCTARIYFVSQSAVIGLLFRNAEQTTSSIYALAFCVCAFSTQRYAMDATLQGNSKLWFFFQLHHSEINCFQNC